MMNFDNQPVGSYGDGGAAEWQHFVAFAATMARIDQNWQMAEPLHGRHETQIERVAGMIGEGAYSALAEYYVVVAFAHYIFGSHQQFFQRRRHSTLEQYRFMRSPSALKQRKILHVARPNLSHVRILLDTVTRSVIHCFGIDQQ